jgi:hypothetical protein
MRRRLLLALCALAIVAAMPVHAQDARSSEAQDAARDWLAIVDKGDAGTAYASAGERFRRQVSNRQWAKGMADAREPLGAYTRRTIESTRFVDRIQGVGKGDFAMLVFRSSFANKDFVREQVTLENTATGWKVIGYLIR